MQAQQLQRDAAHDAFETEYIGGLRRLVRRIVGDDFAGEHADWIRPELRVQRIADSFAVPFLGEIEMSHLGDGMDAGIGAASTARDIVLAGEGLDRLG